MTPLTAEDRLFLKEFYRAVMDAPLTPDDPRYVRLYEDHDALGVDPVELLEQTISYVDDSVQLLAGFRGIGKSTELRRLQKRIEGADGKVVLIDIAQYINMSTPIDVSDFLMSITGAFGMALEDDELLGKSGLDESVWERFRSFLASIKLSEYSAEIAAKAKADADVAGMSKGAEVSAKLGLKGSFKEDPIFKQRVQKHMAGHLGGLVVEVHKFFEECIKALRKKYGNGVKVLMIVDSIEQIRGTFTNGTEVQASVENLFAMHAAELRIPGLHVIYTIPPFLKVRYPNLGSLYPAGAVQMFPAIKIKDKNDNVATSGKDALVELIKKRHSRATHLLSDAQMERMVAESGGHLRNLLRMVAEVIRRAKKLPVDDWVITQALDQMRTELLPIAENDALWLAQIAITHKAALEDQSNLIQLARFFDTNMVLCYRNGPEWYDVHPLIRGHVLQLAKEVQAARAAKKEHG